MKPDELRSKLRGAIAFPVTPFKPDLSVDIARLRRIDIGHRYSGTVAGFMNTVGNLGQVISIPVVAWLAVLAGTPGQPTWKVSLYYYAVMFFIASVSWLFVNPQRVIVYAAAQPGGKQN